MMYYIKKGFSLIEVVIATSILSITVFGVYKLIGENTKIINNSGNYFQVNSLFPIIEECIKYNSGNLIDNAYYFSIGSNFKKCNYSTSQTGFYIDGEYYTTEINRNSNIWEISISSENTKIITKNFNN